LPTRGQRLRVAIANFHNKETGKGCRPLTRFLAKDFGQYFRDTNVRENRFELVPYQSLRFIEHKCNIANDNFLCTDSELATLADIFITGSWDNNGELTVKAVLLSADPSRTRQLAIHQETVNLRLISKANRHCWKDKSVRQVIRTTSHQDDAVLKIGTRQETTQTRIKIQLTRQCQAEFNQQRSQLVKQLRIKLTQQEKTRLEQQCQNELIQQRIKLEQQYQAQLTQQRTSLEQRHKAELTRQRIRLEQQHQANLAQQRSKIEQNIRISVTQQERTRLEQQYQTELTQQRTILEQQHKAELTRQRIRLEQQHQANLAQQRSKIEQNLRISITQQERTRLEQQRTRLEQQYQAQLTQQRTILEQQYQIKLSQQKCLKKQDKKALTATITYPTKGASVPRVVYIRGKLKGNDNATKKYFWLSDHKPLASTTIHKK